MTNRPDTLNCPAHGYSGNTGLYFLFILFTQNIHNHRFLDTLYPRYIPAIAPIPLHMIEANENTSEPNIEGINPPIVEPTAIPNIIRIFMPLLILTCTYGIVIQQESTMRAKQPAEQFCLAPVIKNQTLVWYDA